VLFLSRVLALQYFLNSVDDAEITARCRQRMLCNAVPFLLFFLAFLIAILLGNGWAVDSSTGVVSIEKYKYFHNLLEMPVVLVILLLGVVAVLASILMVVLNKRADKAVWFGGAGTILTVLALLLCAGWNNTCYYPSLADAQSSLNIYNSSSSMFTLEAMSIVSLFIPVVAIYIWYAWRSLNRKKITATEIDNDAQAY